jgi:hypothetical protein
VGGGGPEADDQLGFFVYLNTGDGFDNGKQWQSNLGGDNNWKNSPTHIADGTNSLSMLIDINGDPSPLMSISLEVRLWMEVTGCLHLYHPPPVKIAQPILQLAQTPYPCLLTSTEMDYPIECLTEIQVTINKVSMYFYYHHLG